MHSKETYFVLVLNERCLIIWCHTSWCW